MKLAINNNKPEITLDIIDNWIDIQEDDIKAVEKYLREKPISIIEGGILKEFEERFAEMFGAKYAVAFCNGTAALHAASFACGAKENSNFILSAYSYFGTVNSVLENSANVILCDYENNTLNIDTNSAEQNITDNTEGIVITHIWGNPANMDRLNQIREKYKLKIISDASHAYGAKWKGENIGSLATEDIACFSLGKNKLISGGELGVALTNNPELYDSMLFLGHPNRVPNSFLTSKFKRYSNSIGNKFRPHTISMVLAISQMNRFKDKIRQNIETNAYISNEINKISGFSTLLSYPESERVYWKNVFKIESNYWGNVDKIKVIQALKSEGVEVQQFHNYNIKENLELWSYPRYEKQLQNRCNSLFSNDLIIIPAYISITKAQIQSLINCFSKVSENKNELSSQI